MLALILFAALAQDATVVRIVDGDTLVAQVDGVDTRIRIWGIDAPERGHEGSRESTAELSRVLPIGARIMLQDHGKDRYGRTVSRVVIDGLDAGEHMVCSGFARWYRRYAPNAANLAACEGAR